MDLILVAVIFLVLAVVILILGMRIMDLGDEVRRLKNRSEWWQSEARRVGWKHPVDQAIDGLNEGVGKLEEAARVVEEAARRSSESARAARGITDDMRAARDDAVRVDGALKKAARHLQKANEVLSGSSSAGRVRRKRVVPAAGPTRPVAANRLQEMRVAEAIRELEKGSRESEGEIDPSKLN